MDDTKVNDARQARKGTTAFTILRVSLVLIAFAFAIMLTTFVMQTRGSNAVTGTASVEQAMPNSDRAP